MGGGPWRELPLVAAYLALAVLALLWGFTCIGRG